MPLCRRPLMGTAVATLLVGACAGEAPPAPSPITLWNIRPGMSLAQLDSVAFHNERKRHQCASAEAGFRRCTVATENIFGEMEAVVDTADRVVMITFRPDFESMGGFTDMSGSVYLHAGMRGAALSAPFGRRHRDRERR